MGWQTSATGFDRKMMQLIYDKLAAALATTKWSPLRT